MKRHVDTFLKILHESWDLVSRVERLLGIGDGMDIVAVHAHVSKLAPFQQELEEREEVQYLSKVSYIRKVVAMNTYVALDQTQDLHACRTTTTKVQRRGLHKTVRLPQLCPPWKYLAPDHECSICFHYSVLGC